MAAETSRWTGFMITDYMHPYYDMIITRGFQHGMKTSEIYRKQIDPSHVLSDETTIRSFLEKCSLKIDYLVPKEGFQVPESFTIEDNAFSLDAIRIIEQHYSKDNISYNLNPNLSEAQQKFVAPYVYISREEKLFYEVYLKDSPFIFLSNSIDIGFLYTKYYLDGFFKGVLKGISLDAGGDPVRGDGFYCLYQGYTEKNGTHYFVFHIIAGPKDFDIEEVNFYDTLEQVKTIYNLDQ